MPFPMPPVHVVVVRPADVKLLEAAIAGDVAGAETAVAAGAALDNADQDGLTCLMEVALRGHAGVATLLLAKARLAEESRFFSHPLLSRPPCPQGAALETKDKNGRTALMWACTKGQATLAALLLTKGAALEAADSACVLLASASRVTHERAPTFFF